MRGLASQGINQHRLMLLNSHVEIRNQYVIRAAVPNARRAMGGIFFFRNSAAERTKERKGETERAMHQAVHFCALWQRKKKNLKLETKTQNKNRSVLSDAPAGYISPLSSPPPAFLPSKRLSSHVFSCRAASLATCWIIDGCFWFPLRRSWVSSYWAVAFPHSASHQGSCPSSTPTQQLVLPYPPSPTPLFIVLYSLCRISWPCCVFRYDTFLACKFLILLKNFQHRTSSSDYKQPWKPNKRQIFFVPTPPWTSPLKLNLLRQQSVQRRIRFFFFLFF